MAGIPLNCRQAKKSVSDGRGTGASGQKGTREKLGGRTGGRAEPISHAPGHHERGLMRSGKEVSFMLFWVTGRSRGSHLSAGSNTSDNVSE